MELKQSSFTKTSFPVVYIIFTSWKHHHLLNNVVKQGHGVLYNESSETRSLFLVTNKCTWSPTSKQTDTE